MGFFVFCGYLPLVVGGRDAPLRVTADAPLRSEDTSGENQSSLSRSSSAVSSVSRLERNNCNRVFTATSQELLTSSISVKFILCRSLSSSAWSGTDIWVVYLT